MVKLYNKFLMLCALIFWGSKCFAMVDTVRIGGIRYELRDDGERLTSSVINSRDSVNDDRYSPYYMGITKYSDYKGDVVIPESVIYNGLEYQVTSISDYAFVDCYDMKSIVLPDAITSIGSSAFSGCMYLNELILPERLRYIGDNALKNCCRLHGIVIPQGLDSIPDGVFCGCVNIEEIRFPEGIRYIGAGVFEYCNRLESIHFPGTLEEIGNFNLRYFQFDCPNLSNVYIEAMVPPVQKKIKRGYNDSDETVGDLYRLWWPCVLHVPAGTKELYSESEGWNYFKSTVEFDTGSGPDYGYSLSDDIKYANPFYDFNSEKFDNLHEIDGLTYSIMSEEERTCCVAINRYILHGNVHVPETVMIDSVEYTVISVSSVGLFPAIRLEGITFPNTLKSIAADALLNAHKLETIRIPESVEELKIGLGHCTSLKELIIGSEKIEITQLTNCLVLDDIYLLNASDPSAVSLPVFTEKNSRQRIILHVPEESVEAFESISKFSNNYLIAGLLSDDPMPDTVSSNGYTADLVSNNIYYTVQPEGVMVAAHVVNREKFRENFGFDGPLTPRDPIAGGQQPRTPMRVHSMNALGTGTDTGLEDYTPYNGNLIIPESVSANGSTYSVLGTDYYAFIGCTELDTVSFPESVTTLGYGSFAGCIGLKGVNIPSGVVSVPDAMFYGCTSLDGVVLPEGIATIGHSAFYNCSGLTEIVIPASVELIDEYAFFGCTGLKRIVIEGNPEIAPTAFMGVPTEVVVLLWKESGILGGNPVHYSPDGRIIPADRPGLHIIKAPDGSVSKVMVR